ncbi:related to GPI transamidase component GPI17 [Saccharomycodes ludwigii]|uniref:Related to GPI transamidase component GPI17 n=1 Tax=Saccharomycodes ludwigii TaxID=36035 RepID=A0A376BC31_9ASCO|nr:hypothetical protein SCDLUD_003323 [Saccharomycodes ludwigii]KAH3900349.1 hypothetical protein SCDLUD_003323 [Saccharomycodes ludwigii]SSD62176.1 related to GPI transamidase component GPI17 [Saccharomycodes ludwigii]
MCNRYQKLSRRLVCITLILLYCFIGIPLWYKLTTVYRAQLPTQYIKSLHENKHQDIHMVIPVYLNFSTYKFPDLDKAVQAQTDSVISNIENGWDVNWSLQLQNVNQNNLNYTTDFYKDKYVVQLILDDFVGCSVPYDGKDTIVFYNEESILSNDLPFFIAQSLMEHTFKLEYNLLRKGAQNGNKNGDSNIAIEYSPQVHISLSVLTGKGYPVSWEIEDILNEYFTPFRKFISPVVNLTVDTEIIYYNDLNLNKLHNSIGNFTHDPIIEDLSAIIDLSELTGKNNYYANEKSVLNLAIVFPEHDLPHSLFKNGSPVTHENDTFAVSSFLVPQWGSLIINEHALPSNPVKLSKAYLKPIIYKFSNEIFQLLGLSDFKESLSTPMLTIDSFKRITTIYSNLDKSVDTLRSLVDMTEELPQMAIPKQVADDVMEALDLRLEIVGFLNNPNDETDELIWDIALRKSNELVDICEHAFFHKDMMQQNFVPQEHKIAVYLPLLGPISVVCFGGLIKSLKEKSLCDGNEADSEETKKEK